jgi:hypothetical protein
MGPKIEFVKEQFQSMFDAVKETYGQVLIKAGRCTSGHDCMYRQQDTVDEYMYIKI